MTRSTRDASKQDRQHDDPPTTARFLPTIIDTTHCISHDASEGQACFAHWPLTDGLPLVISICNRRAVRAGYDAPVDPHSLTSRPVGRRGSR